MPVLDRLGDATSPQGQEAEAESLEARKGQIPGSRPQGSKHHSSRSPPVIPRSLLYLPGPLLGTGLQASNADHPTGVELAAKGKDRNQNDKAEYAVTSLDG